MATQIWSASSATPPPMPVMRMVSPREIPARAMDLHAVSPAKGHAAICSSLRCAGVWSQQKIDKAVQLGAKGGVRYSSDSWPDDLGALLKQNRAQLAAVIDSGGDEIMGKTSKYLKNGGKVVCYGMTAAPTISMTMREVMRGQQLIGTMMGSRADLVAATAFLTQHKITPIVAAVLPGLRAAEEGFQMMEKGSQFGKIVVKVGEGEVKANL